MVVLHVCASGVDICICACVDACENKRERAYMRPNCDVGNLRSSVLLMLPCVRPRFKKSQFSFLRMLPCGRPQLVGFEHQELDLVGFEHQEYVRKLSFGKCYRMH